MRLTALYLEARRFRDCYLGRCESQSTGGFCGLIPRPDERQQVITETKRHAEVNECVSFEAFR